VSICSFNIKKKTKVNFQFYENLVGSIWKFWKIWGPK